MRALAIGSAYFWKEWRDQRAGILGFALLAPLLLTIALLAIPGAWARADVMPTFIAAGALLIAALTLVSDCVPGEIRRGSLGFLARLPGDLATAFTAKLLFVAAACAAFTAWGWFCATSLSAALAGGVWLEPLHWNLFFPSNLELIALTAWLFAVSCALPRGTTTLPAALLALAFIGGLALVAFVSHRNLRFFAEERRGLFVWLVATALLAAALSFLRGARHGRRTSRVVGWTAAGLLFAAAPVWAWGTWRLHDYLTIDLANGSVALEPVAVSPNGRFLYMNGRARFERYGSSLETSAVHPLVIDLELGTAREAARPETYFRIEPGNGWVSRAVRAPVVLLADELEPLSPGGPQAWLDGFAADRGERMSAADWKRFTTSDNTAAESAARASASIVRADGTRVWGFGGIAHFEKAGEAPRTVDVAVRGPFSWSPHGAGFVAGNSWFDATAERLIPRGEVENVMQQVRGGKDSAYFTQVVTIGPAGFLLAECDGARFRRFVLWRPGTTTIDAARGFAGDDRFVTALDDGRVVVNANAKRFDGGKAPGWIALVDFAAGTRTPLTLPAGVDPAEWIPSSCGRLDDGSPLLFLHDAEGAIESRGHLFVRKARVVAIGADGTMRATAAIDDVDSSGVLGAVGRNAVLLLAGDRRVVRANFDGATQVQLFPRGDAR